MFDSFGFDSAMDFTMGLGSSASSNLMMDYCMMDTSGCDPYTMDLCDSQQYISQQLQQTIDYHINAMNQQQLEYQLQLEQQILEQQMLEQQHHSIQEDDVIYYDDIKVF